jgi:hypothetical protein
MLVIRKSQEEVLAKASFAQWLVNHSRRFFPSRCKELGSEGLKAFIDVCIRKAKVHGLTEGPDVCSFLDLAMTFAEDFDTALPWAKAILSEADGHANAITMDRLHAAAIAILEKEGLPVE